MGGEGEEDALVYKLDSTTARTKKFLFLGNFSFFRCRKSFSKLFCGSETFFFSKQILLDVKVGLHSSLVQPKVSERSPALY